MKRMHFIVKRCVALVPFLLGGFLLFIGLLMMLFGVWVDE